jgi:hypothetical protein
MPRARFSSRNQAAFDARVILFCVGCGVINQRVRAADGLNNSFAGRMIMPKEAPFLAAS